MDDYAEFVTGEPRLGFFWDSAGHALPFPGELNVAKEGQTEIRVPLLRPRQGTDRTEFDELYEKLVGWGKGPSRVVPTALLFRDAQGPVALTGVRWAGTFPGLIGELRMRASAAFFGKPTKLSDKYSVRLMESELEGLHQFAGLKQLYWDEETRRREGLELAVALRQVNPITWRADGFDFEIRTHTAKKGQDGHYARVKESTRLVTQKIEGATVQEHLRAQRSVRALLVLTFGRQVRWEGHWVRSDAFDPVGSQKHFERVPTVRVAMEQTLGDVSARGDYWRHSDFPVAILKELPADALRGWTRCYLRSRLFRRAVDPAVEALASTGGFAEMRIMVLAAALDSFAYYSGRRDGYSLNEQLTWCLDQACISWPSIASNAKIALRLAQVNNYLKHADREKVPSNEFLIATLLLLEVAARGQLLGTLKASDEVKAFFASSPPVMGARDALESAW